MFRIQMVWNLEEMYSRGEVSIELVHSYLNDEEYKFFKDLAGV